MSVREEERKKCKRAGKYTQTCIFERWKESLDIPPAVVVNKETVRTRTKRFNTRGLKEAVTLPILEGEPYILLS